MNPVPKLSDMDFRLAQPLDAGFVGNANWGWLREQADRDGPLHVCPENHRVHMDLFWAYVRGARDGLAVLFHPKGGGPRGVALAGEDIYPSRYMLTRGRVAHVWLVWVEPELRQQGVGLAMLAWGRTRLRALGFQHATCATLGENPAGEGLARAYGIVPVETSWACPL